MNSFLQGKRILKAEALGRPTAATGSAQTPLSRPQRTAGPAAPASVTAAAHVEAVKEGDKVVRLIVTCACGERVEVECLYPAGS
jgi:hypothetical protein